MKPLLVLLVVFTLALLYGYLKNHSLDFAVSARVAMAAMLMFTAIGHFKFAEGMTLMIPRPVPFKEAIVYISGFLEVVAAIALLIPRFQYAAGWFLVLFFLAVLPANIYASINSINYERPGEPGPGPSYLWFRIPLQILFIAWVYFSAIRPWSEFRAIP